MPESRIPGRVKKVVAERAGGRCEYCLSPVEFSIAPFVIEHVVPKTHGGKGNLDNLALACQGCNGHKYNKLDANDPVTGERVPLFHPRRDNWSEHFAWSADFTLLLGITSIGRATITELALNRPGVVNFRRVLFANREIPRR